LLAKAYCSDCIRQNNAYWVRLINSRCGPAGSMKDDRLMRQLIQGIGFDFSVDKLKSLIVYPWLKANKI
jgi:hypothetical protein